MSAKEKSLPRSTTRLLISKLSLSLFLSTHRRENGILLVIENITERHLGALVLVDLDLGMIDIWNLFELDAVLDHDSRCPHRRVGRHLDGTEATALVTLFAELGCAICGNGVAKGLVNRGHFLL